MTRDESPGDDPMLRELNRIFGDVNSDHVRGSFVSLPLFDEQEALTFLRTVPAGATLETIERMADSYRGANPRDRG